MIEGRVAPARTRLALLLLLPLLLLAVVLAWTVRLRGVLGVDSRHYFEMATGFRAHGLPYTLNAYSEYFPEARPRFNVPRDGKLWGQYPPVFPALASIALRIAGTSGIVKENFFVLGALALAVFFLGWRLSRDPLQGVAASYLTLLATPLWAASMQTPAQPTMLVFVVLGTHAALVARDLATSSRRGSRAAASACGLCFGLAIGSHLLAFPMALFVVAAMLWLDGNEPPGTPARLVPKPEQLVRGGCVALGVALPLVPVSLLNRARFGTYNPLTYGPCPWKSCTEYGGIDAFGAGRLLRYGGVSLLFVLVVLGAAFALRRRRIWVVGALLLALAASYALRASGLPIWDMLRTLYGYFVDTTPITFATGTYTDDFGHLWGVSLVKSVFQCSPILLCAVLAPVSLRGPHARTLLVASPLIGLVASLALLSRYPGAWAFGFPHLLLRYAMPAVPVLAVLVVIVLAPLAWKRWHAAVVVVTAAAGLIYFEQTGFDLGLVRRIVLLRVSLLIGAGSAACIVLARAGNLRAAHTAPVLAALAIGLSLATSQAVDNRMLAIQVHGADRFYARLGAVTPQRFALAGYGADSDPALSIRGSRQVSYVDLGEGTDWTNFRTLMDLWADDGLPLYAIFQDHQEPFRWPYAEWDVRATLLDEEFGIWKIEPPEPGRRLTPEQIGALRQQLHEAWLARGKRAP